MAIRINGATLTPNPVNVSSIYKLLVSIEEYLMENVGLLDNSADAIHDVGANRLYVTNDVITSISYTSVYSDIQMDTFILSVLSI